MPTASSVGHSKRDWQKCATTKTSSYWHTGLDRRDFKKEKKKTLFSPTPNTCLSRPFFLLVTTANAHSPLAMGILTGKYHVPPFENSNQHDEENPSQFRLNKYKHKYEEAEARYSLAKPNLRPAVLAYQVCEKPSIDRSINQSINKHSLEPNSTSYHLPFNAHCEMLHAFPSPPLAEPCRHTWRLSLGAVHQVPSSPPFYRGYHIRKQQCQTARSIPRLRSIGFPARRVGDGRD